MTGVQTCALPISSEGDGTLVDTSNAIVGARDGAALRVVFAAEGQPAVLFKPADGAWDWSRTGKLVIPVENPGGEPVTLLLRVSDGADRSLSGKISIAPGTASIRRDRPSSWSPPWRPCAKIRSRSANVSTVTG